MSQGSRLGKAAKKEISVLAAHSLATALESVKMAPEQGAGGGFEADLILAALELFLREGRLGSVVLVEPSFWATSIQKAGRTPLTLTYLVKGAPKLGRPKVAREVGKAMESRARGSVVLRISLSSAPRSLTRRAERVAQVMPLNWDLDVALLESRRIVYSTATSQAEPPRLGRKWNWTQTDMPWHLGASRMPREVKLISPSRKMKQISPSQSRNGLQRQLRSELAGLSFFEASEGQAVEILSCAGRSLLTRQPRFGERPPSKDGKMAWAVVWTARSMVDSEHPESTALPRGLSSGGQLRQLATAETAFLVGLPMGNMAPRHKRLQASPGGGPLLRESSAAQAMAQEGQPPWTPDVDFDFYRQVQEEEMRRFLGRQVNLNSRQQVQGKTGPSNHELLIRQAVLLQAPEVVGLVTHDTPMLERPARNLCKQQTQLHGLSLIAQLGCHHAAIVFSKIGRPCPKYSQALRSQAVYTGNMLDFGTGASREHLQ
mmetsp:Transcript_92261/g.164169  ORF Transcript_92261/g.164169 Transcript_92261/m.164169 type:complete len:488 (+) Transcript_92261:464-1927(+)